MNSTAGATRPRPCVGSGVRFAARPQSAETTVRFERGSQVSPEPRPAAPRARATRRRTCSSRSGRPTRRCTRWRGSARFNPRRRADPADGRDRARRDARRRVERRQHVHPRAARHRHAREGHRRGRGRRERHAHARRHQERREREEHRRDRARGAPEAGRSEAERRSSRRRRGSAERRRASRTRPA